MVVLSCYVRAAGLSVDHDLSLRYVICILNRAVDGRFDHGPRLRYLSLWF